MAHEKTEGVKKELKGIWTRMVGAVTRDENKKLEGEAQIVEGDNLKDYGDQKENIEKGKTRPGDPTNL